MLNQSSHHARAVRMLFNPVNALKTAADVNSSTSFPNSFPDAAFVVDIEPCVIDPAIDKVSMNSSREPTFPPLISAHLLPATDFSTLLNLESAT